jgi:LAO/AO transport system kinase
MEIGDVFVINKSDREGVLRTQKELEALLSLAHRPDVWDPPIVKTIATENKGIEDLARSIESYVEFGREHESHSQTRKTAIARWRLVELLQERLLKDVLDKNGSGQKLDDLSEAIAEKRMDPYSAVDELLGNI